jgi:hypothetical protein
MEDNKDKLCGNVCADERFDMIARAKSELMRSTNIETNKKEMEVIDSILYRFWQMGWLQLINCEIASKNIYRDYNRYGAKDPKLMLREGESIDDWVDRITPSAYVMSPMDLHETMKCVATTCLRLRRGEKQEPPRTETSDVEKIDIGEISKGNIVRTHSDDTPCVVTAILPGGSVGLTRHGGASKLSRFVCYADLAPIPLTTGILEKTGFHHSMPYNDWTNDTVDLILYDAADGYAVQNTSITIRYVHQFQNLLKQCKTKIEVKL